MSNQATSFHLAGPINRAGEVFLRGLSRITETARFVVRTLGAHNKALIFSAFCFLTSASWAATPAGTTLTNTVSTSYMVSGTAYNNSVSLSVTTDGAIQFMAATPTGAPITVAATQCASSGSTSGPFDLTSSVAAGSTALAPVTMYSNGQDVYIQVTDLSKNLNPAALDTVAVTITSSNSPNDTETLLLTETGPNTGVFVGAISTIRGSVTSNNCSLSVAVHSTISASYQRGPTTSTATASALVNPYGVVFNADRKSVV